MYTHEIRHRAIVHYTYFAREYGVGKSTLCRWLSKRLGHPCCKKDANDMKTFIGEIVSQNPFTTASGIVETLSSRHDIETSKSSVYRTLRSKGFTFKKSQRTKVCFDLDIHLGEQCQVERLEAEIEGHMKRTNQIHKVQPL